MAKVDSRTPKQIAIDERKAAFQSSLVDHVVKHEGLVPFQTPFRITSSGMEKWVSMFDDTIKMQLAPKYPKPAGREKFLYVKKQEDVKRGVNEQFRRYAATPKNYGLPDNPTISDAIVVFDQTGAPGKLEYLSKNGININTKLKEIY